MIEATRSVVLTTALVNAKGTDPKACPFKRFRPTGCPANCPVGRRTIVGKLRLYLFSEAVRTFTGVL